MSTSLTTNRFNYRKRLLKSVAEGVAALLPEGTKTKISGPCGLCCRYSILFYRKGRGRVLHLEYDRGFGYGVRTAELKDPLEFKSGTIGYLSGMNYVFAKRPPKAGAGWYHKYLSKSFKINVQEDL